jgi:WD40 repeat protein
MQQTFAEAAILTGHEAPVKLVTMSPDGRLLATADVDRQLKVWQDGKVVLDKSLRTWNDRFLALDRIRSMQFWLDSQRLYVASGETVKAYRVPDEEPIWEHGRLPTWAFLITCPQCIAISSKGEMAAVYDDGALEIHRGNHRVVWTDNDVPKTFSYLRDGTRIAGTDGISICIWDAGTGAKLAKRKPRRKIFGLATSPVKDVIATRSLHELELWDSETGERQASIATSPGLPILAFHPNREMLVAGDARGFFYAGYDGTIYKRIDTQGFSPLSFAFSPTGDRLYVGCSDCAIRIWEVDL